ncbi:hypothetical protein J6590_025718 [Homalodisca vitripennis]|nr:hypothetical protein J6590_025718 [Homalodisca vitripennis]
MSFTLLTAICVNILLQISNSNKSYLFFSSLVNNPIFRPSQVPSALVPPGSRENPISSPLSGDVATVNSASVRATPRVGRQKQVSERAHLEPPVPEHPVLSVPTYEKRRNQFKNMRVKGEPADVWNSPLAYSKPSY